MKKAIILTLNLIFSMTIIYGQKVVDITTDIWIKRKWVQFFKQNNTYDENGYLTSSVNFFWNTRLKSWEKNCKSNFTNNPDGTAQQCITQFWNISSNSWTNMRKQNNIYDGKGHLTYTLGQSWDASSNSWKNSSQITYPNNNDTVQQYITQTWDNTSNAWADSQRETITYDTNHKKLKDSIDIWLGNEWYSLTKIYYTYDKNGYLTSMLYNGWNEPTKSWIDRAKNDYTNNTNGAVQQYISLDWNDASKIWVNNQRTKYTYDN